MNFNNKKEIRTFIKEELNTHTKNFSIWSEKICEKLLKSKEYKEAQNILSYMALPDEVNLLNFMNTALSSNKKVYIPRIIPQSNLMDFYEYNPKSCISGSFGISEPELTENIFDDISENTLILIPGRAFTLDGKRLGRGKGFYDQYLEKLLNKKGNSTNSKVTFLGICFKCQILPDLPTEPHDILMHRIISEE